ncbi:MAG: tyrosine-type recombinase/integrase [Thiomonas sp.]
MILDSNPSAVSTPEAPEPNDAPASILHWPLEGLQINAAQREKFGTLRRWIIQSDLEAARVLVNPDTVAAEQLSDSAMRELERAVIGRFRPLREAAEILRLLQRGIDWLRLNGKADLPPLRAPVLIRRPASPFRDDTVDLLARARTWQDALLCAGRTVTDAVDILGCLLMSAQVFGAALHPQVLGAILRNVLQEDDHLGTGNQWPAVAMSLHFRGQEAAEFRRWHPDLMTLCWMARWTNMCRTNPPILRTLREALGTPASSAREEELVWAILAPWFRHRVESSFRPHSLPACIATLRRLWAMRLPGVLLGYADRTWVSHALYPLAWSRIHGVAPPASASLPDAARTERHETDSESALLTQIEKQQESSDALRPAWLMQIRRALRSGSHKSARAELAPLLRTQTPCTSSDRFAEYVDFSLSNPSAAGNRLSLPTLQGYVGVLWRTMMPFLGTSDPVLLDNDEGGFDLLYAQALESIDDTQDASRVRRLRRSVVRALRSFHHFLVTVHGKHWASARLLSAERGLVPVDANLITEEEFQKLQAILRDHPPVDWHPELARTMRLILLLAFRCGLRRSEILKLRMMDVHLRGPGELLVRPTAQRRLKTRSATRRIPLSALLSPAELDELRAYNRERIFQGANREADFFAPPTLPASQLAPDVFLTRLHHLMRSVLGDPSLRFHHLRHSFATWTFARLLAPRNAPGFGWPKGMPIQGAALPWGDDLMQKLFGHASPTRKKAYAVASLLGHAGPELSLEHYIHSCDLLVLQHAMAAQTGIGAAAYADALGQSHSTIKATLHHGGPNALVRWLIKKSFKADVASAVHPPSLPDTAGTPAQNLHQLSDFLLAASKQPSQVPAYAKHYGYAEDYANKLIAAAQSLLQLRTAGHGPSDLDGYRHPAELWTPDHRYADLKQRTLCPRRPREQRDIQILERLAPRMTALLLDDPSLARRTLAFWATHEHPRRSELRFTDPDHPEFARDFMALLAALKIGREERLLISRDPAKRSSHRARWRRALGLNPHEVFTAAPKQKKADSREVKWLEIRVVFATGHAAPSRTAMKGSIAWRYLLALAYIKSMARAEHLPAHSPC